MLVSEVVHIKRKERRGGLRGESNGVQALAVFAEGVADRSTTAVASVPVAPTVVVSVVAESRMTISKMFKITNKKSSYKKDWWSCVTYPSPRQLDLAHKPYPAAEQQQMKRKKQTGKSVTPKTQTPQ